MRTRILAVLLFACLGVSLGVANAIADAPEHLTADTPKTTVTGNTFVAPSGWSFVVRGPATILEAPEGGSFVALVDIPVKDAATADAAVKAAWAAYKPDAKWPLKVVTPIADRDGWTNRSFYDYETSPNEKRDISANVRRAKIGRAHV